MDRVGVWVVDGERGRNPEGHSALVNFSLFSLFLFLVLFIKQEI